MVDLQEHESGRRPYRIEQIATDYQHIVNNGLCFGRVEPFDTLLDWYRAIQLKAN